MIGGPGTGKTTALVESVAARVAEGVPADRVLVLAFDRRAAQQLREQLGRRLGATRPAAGPTVARGTTGLAELVRLTQPAGLAGAVAEPVVRTFQGYAFGLLRRAAIIEGEPPPRLLTAAEQDLVIRDLLQRDIEALAERAEQAAEQQSTAGKSPAGEPAAGKSSAGEPIGAAGWPPGLASALPTRAFTAELRDLLSRATERGIGPQRLADLAVRHKRADWAAAARFFRGYLQVLALRDVTEGSIAYDYAELVHAATRLLRSDPGLLAAERARTAHVYVDDLVNTDPSQIALLTTIAGGGGNLVAFADPDASIFAFRGADPTIVGDFGDRFPTSAGAPGPQVLLTRSYRAGELLLGATRRVAARLRGPARHRLLEPAATAPDLPEQVEPASAADPPGAVDLVAGPTESLEVRTFGSEAAEAAHVALRLRAAHLLGGVPWSRMAVLVRSTLLQLAPVRRALLAAGVPVTVEAPDLPLHVQPAVAALLLAVRCALRPEHLDEQNAVALLHSPLGGADPLAERRLRQGLRALSLAGGDNRPSGDLIVEALLTCVEAARGTVPSDLAAFDQGWAWPAQRVGELLAAARAAAGQPGGTIEDVLWAIWNGSGLARQWAAASVEGALSADRDLDAVVALFDTAARFVDRLPGAGAELFVDYLEGQELPVDSIAPTADRGQAVRILTAHAAKGQQWDVVAVVGVQEGLWPDLRLRGTVLGSELLVESIAGQPLDVAAQLSMMLDEERRLFHVAVTRARRRLIVTAVAAGDGAEQPSRFLDELRPTPVGQPEEPADPAAAGRPGIGGPGVRPADADEPAAVTLPALVAQLRAVVGDPAVPAERRSAAARQLARLAEVGVPGAHPDQWWGLPALSDDRPVAGAGEPVHLTPSTVDSVRRCSLRWLLERHGGGGPGTPERSLGNLVHATAMLAEDAGVDRAALAEYLAERFDAIELSARWLAGRERDRAEAMLDKLVGWLAGNPRRLVGIEREFLVELADPEAPIEIRGRVDRLEMDDAGRLVVIDLKTGRTIPAEAALAEHGQLAAYQVAVEAGAFEESTVAGGGSLVQLGGESQAAREQRQAPLAETEHPEWAGDLIRRTARTMAASTFEAVSNQSCRVCPVRVACPISGKGRHVIEGNQ